MKYLFTNRNITFLKINIYIYSHRGQKDYHWLSIIGLL